MSLQPSSPSGSSSFGEVRNASYPIGKYEPQPYSERQRKRWLIDIQQLPGLLEDAILNLDEAQLHTPYREGGWTVHQVVHHVADSHMNALCRIKLTLTEENPTIKPYKEALWAELNDVKMLPVNVSLTMLHGIHAHVYALLYHATEADWERTYFHPESGKQFTLWHLLGSYAWHGRHHTAHITSLRERMGWN
jgi:uncharacterized damage-inducible protein DinB